ncbi:hypothetical protein [Viridibacillus arvi]|uniref:hypothetical protein n=1 Tax=Viridibacillus arvi TaxID=263475 RepID=UPI00187B77FF|nr:hypothetical protein [Viridibacillus sp. JNUCC-6]QOV10922.1 hypothetical protein JNUCC6_20530 [Viridibacillus sp. JNUCC-6]
MSEKKKETILKTSIKNSITGILFISIFISIFYRSDVKTDFLNNIAMFNVTFSVGIGAVLVGVIALLDKSNSTKKKEKVINFICMEFPGFIFLNFIVLMFSFAKVKEDDTNDIIIISNVMQWAGGIAVCIGTLYVIYMLRSLFLSILKSEKKQDYILNSEETEIAFIYKSSDSNHEINQNFRTVYRNEIKQKNNK